jgi:F1F0 ATPase subunit 2
MIELSPVLLALAAGLVLGAVYFGGLWWTILRSIGSRLAALWFFVSLLVRTAVAMLGFYLVARGSWERLVVCLAGFVVARFIVIWLTAALGPRPQSAGGTNHAS